MDNMQEQMGNVSRDEKPKKEPKRKDRDKKKTITKMKNAFDGLICRLDTVEEKNLSQRYISKILTLKIKNWEKQTQKEQNKTSKDCGATTIGITYI